MENDLVQVMGTSSAIDLEILKVLRMVIVLD